MRRLIIAAVLLAGVQGVGAQKIYRCGSGYSQTPCDGSGEQTVVTTTNAQAAKTQDSGNIKEQCKNSVRRTAMFFDPESVQFSEVTRGKADVFTLHGAPIEARSYYVMANAKNRYGAYVGDRIYTCLVSVDDKRVLKVNAPGE